MSFLNYFLQKELGCIEKIEIISESTDDRLSKRQVLKLVEKNKKKLISKLNKKYPDSQHEDIEDAFKESVKKLLETKHKDESSIIKFLNKQIKKELPSVLDKKKCIKKNLSCLKIIKKSTISDQNSISEIIEKAEKILTIKEKQILKMCIQGKSVRFIGKDLNMSSVTTWRLLNSAIDKIRISHGMKSRHKDIRKKR